MRNGGTPFVARTVHDADDRDLTGVGVVASDGGESLWRRDAVGSGASTEGKRQTEHEHHDAENAAVLRHQEVSGGG